MRASSNVRRFGLSLEFALLLGLMACLALATGARGQTAAGDGQLKEPPAKDQGKRWALIIATDYVDAYPTRLRNPEKNAQAIHDLLVQHYGYEKDKAIQMLTGDKATRDNIRKKLGNAFLCDPTQIRPEDSVLVFFAGHGELISEGMGSIPVGVLLPHDMELDRIRKQPTFETTVLFEDVVRQLGLCPAKQKLLILDCCHSGAIFARAMPRSEVDPRRDAALFEQPSLQAVASCRAAQTASDGWEDRPSPFMVALLKGLQTLPVSPENDGYSKFFTITDLFKFVQTEFIDTNSDGQKPDLRNLTTSDGEFRFFPNQNSGFDKYRPKQRDFKLLQAMVPGEYGNWWFQEMPWLIPSLRQAILDKTEIERSSYFQAIRREPLRKAVDVARDHMAKSNEKTKNELMELRLKHLNALLDGEHTREFAGVVKNVADELVENLAKLKAVDLHLLAVLKHSLEAPDAGKWYKEALNEYVVEAKSKGGQSKGSRDQLALRALCYVDRAYYRFEVLNQCEDAVQDCRKVWELVGRHDLPEPFQIFALCREADALQSLGRWGLADKRFDDALSISGMLDPTYAAPLTAHVLSRRGWAYMEQWNFANAEEAFKRSNRILNPEIGADPSKLLHKDADALILWFHNKDGLAMAHRFQGDIAGTIAAYRQLTLDLSKAFKLLREDQALVLQSSEIKTRLIGRWINSMESLIDANLFTDAGDFREADNDLRTSLRYCYVLPERERKTIEAGLLYKRALLLSLRTPVQDLDLAQVCCKSAKDLEGSLVGNQRQLLEFPRLLTPKIVALHKSCADKPDCLETRKAALSQLRDVISLLRDKWKNKDHHDYLELLMFATKILLQESVDADRYNALNDVEMLLGFCRRALRSQQREALPYLRPYYDLAMDTKLRLGPKHVKDLLEIQWEATHGRSYQRKPIPQPTLALYFLKGKTHMLVDVPQGLSKHFVLDEDYSPVNLAKCIDEKTALPLPREVERELRKVASAQLEETAILFHYYDPVLWPHRQSKGPLTRVSGYAGLPSTDLPFVLPRGIRVEAEASAPVAQSPTKN